MTRLRPAVLIVVLAGLCGLAARAAFAEELDRTLRVARGTSLDVRLFGGEVVVRGWARDEVRLHATHFKTDAIDVRTAGQTVTVRARAGLGRPHAIDLTIDVPVWMAVAVAGTYVDISIAGTRAAVNAETVRGDVNVTGGTGTITLKSIEGEVILEGAEGRASLTAVNNAIRVAGLVGPLVAETVQGSVHLRDVRSLSVDVGTVAGDISWEGRLSPSGHYQLATHEGDIDVTLSPSPDATVSVRAFEGLFRSTLPGNVPNPAGRRKRFSFVLGSGAAHIDLETFRGTISLRPTT